MINSNNFILNFDQDSRLVKEHEFRKAIFQNGIDKDYRDIAWRFLFQFYPFNSTKRERYIKKKEKLIEYSIMKMRWLKIYENLKDVNFNDEKLNTITLPPIDFNIKIDLEQDFYRNKHTESTSNPDLELIEEKQEINLDYIKIQTILNISRINISISKLNDDIRQIDKDIIRTNYLTEINSDKNISESEVVNITNSLRNILITFAAFNQNLNENSNQNSLGYTQGMNDLASVFLSVFKEESVAYWCFSDFMLLDTYSTSSLTLNTTQINDDHVLKTNVAHYFSDLGISKKLNHLSYLLSVTDSDMYSKLEQFKMENMNFCHEWLLLCFKRCFKTTEEYQRCFEIVNSHFIEFHNSSLKNISLRYLYSFDLFICLSLLKQFKLKYLNKLNDELDFFENFSEFNKSNYFSQNFKLIIRDAEEIFDKYCIISHGSSFDNDDGKCIDKTSTFKKIKSFIFN